MIIIIIIIIMIMIMIIIIIIIIIFCLARTILGEKIWNFEDFLVPSLHEIHPPGWWCNQVIHDLYSLSNHAYQLRLQTEYQIRHLHLFLSPGFMQLSHKQISSKALNLILDSRTLCPLQMQYVTWWGCSIINLIWSWNLIWSVPFLYSVWI